MSFRIGDTLRIPFALFDAGGSQIVDTDPLNYTWPLSRDGVEVTAPAFDIERPIATDSDLLLVYVLPTTGDYTFGRLAHATAGYRTDLRHGLIPVLATTTDDLVALLGTQPAAPSNTNFAIGDKLYVVRGDDWTQTFTILDAVGDPVNLTGSTFIWRIGYRTADSDIAILEIGSITAAAPLTGAVKVTMTDTQTVALPPDAALWYDLEETTSGSLIRTRGIGSLSVVRDVGDLP